LTSGRIDDSMSLVDFKPLGSALLIQDTMWVIETDRLIIRWAAPSPEDIAILLDLWTDPVVMSNVGFPTGLQTDADKIGHQLRGQKEGEFDRVLIVQLRDSGGTIGECKLGFPDVNGVAHTDIKLQKQYWGNRYGKEIKLALLGYMFERTTCNQVKATPNKGNTASIKLQQSVGGRLVGEGVYRFPDRMRAYTVDVPYYEYSDLREDWEKRRR